MTNPSPWREPREETIGLYPNLVVHDGRQSGSITIGQSRLPVWSIIGTAVLHGWADVEDGWEPTANYGFTAQDLAQFLYDLLEARGEFGRLLLVLANAERLEGLREDAAIAARTPDETVVRIDLGDGEGVTLPPPWWESDLREPVIEQLKRCLAALEADTYD